VLSRLFHWLSHAPLWLLHGLGFWAGLLVWAVSGVYRRRLGLNARLAGYGLLTQLKAATQAGKMVAELPRLWLGKPVRVRWQDAAAFEAIRQQAQAQGRGIMVLAPHIGCWEVVGQSIAEATLKATGERMTVMYRPARQAWLDDIIRASRERPSMQTVPANLTGVRQILRVLKNGQTIGVLPDQVPPMGQGIWSPVFGQDAYTMTLAAKMAQSTNALALLCWCERLSFGRGYVLHTQHWPLDASADLSSVVAQINASVEHSIRVLPEQYLWGYARYKQPRNELNA
jgi:Kdo2-lipid IVA lauroyltransferase/acyltransferase